jgi:hypothetical protein
LLCNAPWGSIGEMARFQMGKVEAAHTGPHGMSQKSDDHTCIPLCEEHHREGKFSYHKLGRKFWTHWGIDRQQLVRTLNERFEDAGK